MIPLVLLFVTATYRPPTPTIGDLITIDFAQPVKVQQTPEFEIVSQSGTRVVVRTFEPRQVTIHATSATGEPVGDVVIPIKSVLAPNDALKPAPLQPPREVPWSRSWWIATLIAAAVAAILWLLVWLRARRRVQVASEPPIAADLRFRQAIDDAVRSPRRWAALADATRAYLAAAYPELGRELTTDELLRKGGGITSGIATILRQGDLEKFSPWGAEPGDFDAEASKALDLIIVEEMAA